MDKWCPQRFRKISKKLDIDQEIINNSIKYAEQITKINPNLPPIFSLNHLSYLTGVEYKYLRNVVERKCEPYKVFRLKKGPPKNKKQNFRIVCVPSPQLMTVQRWITKNILNLGKTHFASYAYSPNSKIIDAATLHTEAKWMIKLDVKNFFESFSEISIYRIFMNFGYQPLVSFELARLCTRLKKYSYKKSNIKYLSVYSSKYKTISTYRNKKLGFLPQGAPSSPMLSNLAMYSFDNNVTNIAIKNGLEYSRYADDLCLSTIEKSFNRNTSQNVIKQVYRIMNTIGLSPNLTKTKIIPPGARKIVLGILVDGNIPKLTKKFRSNIRMHLYYLNHPDIGPAKHADNRGFESVIGLRNYIEGLLAYAKQIDPEISNKYNEQFTDIIWPL